MANGAKNVFLTALKSSKQIGAFAKERLVSPRAPNKRASPCPMNEDEATPALKRAFTRAHGSVESLTSSVSDSEEWSEQDASWDFAGEMNSTMNAFEGKDFCVWPRVEPTQGANQLKDSIRLDVAEVDANNNCIPATNEKYETPTAPNDISDCLSKIDCSQEMKDGTCQIYCHGPVLEAAQNAYIYNDSKSFVDMKMKNDSDVILQNFENLQNMTAGSPTDQQVKKFVDEHFLPPGTEFVNWTPEDWEENPALLESIADADLRSWASDLNKLWKALGRKITRDVEANSGRYSMIYSPNPIIVPGGRFREFYYWDSYWVIRGLLLSEMHTTVKGIIRNFLDMVNKFGFVPNGGRLYFTRRSQPPFLSLMVKEYVEATGDLDFLKEALPTLEREYGFWMTDRSVTFADSDGANYTLNRYASDVNQPRPESYREDVELIRGMEEAKGMEIMSHITSACESGWDFSSRWTGLSYQNRSGTDLLKNLRTRDIIPVDLNSILAAIEKALAAFHGQLGNVSSQDEYTSAYERRTNAIEKILWNEQDGTYYDFIIPENTHNRQYFGSNINPLWTKCYPSTVNIDERERRLHDYLKDVGVLNYPGGIPTSLNPSGEQWDFPNAWAPIVHMMIDGMATSTLAELREEAFKQSQKWINSNWRAYRETNAMFEKYDVTRSDGVPGGGGEYDVQTGFGWTNGVVMTLLDMYGDKLIAEPTDSTTQQSVIRSTTSAGEKSTSAVGSLALSSVITVAGLL